MKQGAIPENPLEAVALAAGLVPTPLLDTIISLLLARTVLVANRLGVFAALADGPQTAAEVVRYWEAEGLVGTRTDILDSQTHARQLRAQSERRDRD